MASTKRFTLTFVLVIGTFYFKTLAISNCPSGFDYSVDGIPKCYSVVTRRLNWDAAQAKCRQLHPKAHLVSINSALENQIVQEMLNDFDCFTTITTPTKAWNANNFWTSGRRTTDNCDSPFVWKASTRQVQSMAYTNWLNGEPNCAFDQEHCLTIQKGLIFAPMQWNDGNCDWKLCSVCEVLRFQQK